MAAKFLRELADIFDEGVATQEVIPQNIIPRKYSSPLKEAHITLYNKSTNIVLLKHSKLNDKPLGL